jgi:hypothetical protein
VVAEPDRLSPHREGVWAAVADGLEERKLALVAVLISSRTLDTSTVRRIRTRAAAQQR